jgi:hypothetical protein
MKKLNEAQARAFVAALNTLCKSHGISIAQMGEWLFMEPLINEDDRWELVPTPNERDDYPIIRIDRKWWK